MSKTLIVGLDGGTFDILLPLIEQDCLPQLAFLLRNGSWGQLESTVPPYTPVAWSTFATGRNPGQHGILSFEKRNRFQYHTQASGYVDGQQLTSTLWEIISLASKRVIVVNVPMTYPPRPVNGLMITGMMTPSNSFNFTYPPELAANLAEYRIDVDFIRTGNVFRRYKFPSKQEMLADIQSVTNIRSRVCLQLIQEQDWDFFMTVYTGTDRLCHFFWDDLTQILLKNQPDRVVPEIRNGLLSYFRQLDADIGAMIESAGADTHVLLMSDHGFGPSPTKQFYVNVWLEQLGLLRTNQHQGIGKLAYWRMRIGRNAQLKAILRRLLSAKTQELLTKKAQIDGENNDIDWATTQAYFVPIYSNVCGIELNTSGDHREGIVQKPEVYRTLCNEIIIAAEAVQDPDSGKPIVQKACHRETLFSGPFVADFPDIILVIDPDYIGIDSLAGLQLVEKNEPFRPGEHRPAGMFAAFGPTIKPKTDLPDLQLADVSATILYLLGLPVPTSFDGRILSEIINSDFWRENPPIFQEVSAAKKLSETENESPISTNQKEKLERRLRGLGYLD